VLRSAALVIGPLQILLSLSVSLSPITFVFSFVRGLFPLFPISCILFPSCFLVPLVRVSLRFSVPFSSIIVSTSIPIVLFASITSPPAYPAFTLHPC
jgi:hypothetical protein